MFYLQSLFNFEADWCLSIWALFSEQNIVYKAAKMRKITPTIILMTLYMCVLQNKSLSKKRLETGVFVAFKMSFVKQSGMYKNSSVFFF